MSPTVSPAIGDDVKKSIRLLSLDAGGPQGISQLLILNDVMKRLSNDTEGAQEPMKRPCDVFDLIGGVGTGGLIAIFLVVLKMTAQAALEEFSNFSFEVFTNVSSDPRSQTERLSREIDGILERHGIAKDVKLIPADEHAPTSKLIVVVMYKDHVGIPCMLRNYTTRHEPPVELTVAEAMLATCATPPLFTPVRILKDFVTSEYVSGDIGFSNPTREVIREAHRTFGDEATVSCLLSIGCGHPGVNAVPQYSTGSWTEFLGRVATDSEKTANDIETQMSRLSVYHRLSVKNGLEKDQMQDLNSREIVIAHTNRYLNDLEVVELIDRCGDTLRNGEGFATLEQLSHSGGTKILLPALPPLTPNYVERRLPMNFIERALFTESGIVKPGPKMIIVTGIGGCGKTQLIRKFVERYKGRFLSTFFIDGSSPDTIRRDVLRNVRALGAAHSQKSFDESMVLLSQTTRDIQRLLIIDNVDEPTLNLFPFLPRWDHGVIMITSRNHSRGQLCPGSHLQLDVMTVDESVELLLCGSGQPWPPGESERKVAISLVEELGCHPIALAQAISYMYNTGCSPGSYINLLRGCRDRLLRDNPATSQVDMRYQTAFAAFDASYNILPQRARAFWHLLSFFRWQRFPVELVTRAAPSGFSIQKFAYLARGDEFEIGIECLKEIFYTSSGWDPLELHSIIATLRSHSLITISPGEDTNLLRMHPLIHEWGKLRMSEGDLGRFEAASVRLICCGAIEDNQPMMQYLFSHAGALAVTCKYLHANDVSSMSFILAESGMYDKAATLNYTVFQQLKEGLGPTHANTVIASANLAVTYARLGRYAEAEALLRGVLNQRKEQLGVDNLLTITATELLAAFSHDLGRYEEAGELKMQVLMQRTEILGFHHPETIWAAEQLAATYHKLGRYTEAEVLETEVLQQQIQRFGVDHPNTIRGSISLAATHQVLGRHGEAEELMVGVLQQRTQMLGVDHPDTIEASSGLAAIYHAMGRYEKAEELQMQVIRQREKLLGVNHPDTIEASAGLAVTYHVLGRYLEAEELQMQVLRQRNDLLGADHPETIRASDHLAVTYNSLGRHNEAKELFSEVLRRRNTLMGQKHPDTIRAMLSLARTYNAMRRGADALPLAQEALRTASEALGEGHPIHRDISTFLASIPDAQPAQVERSGRYSPYHKRPPRK